MSTDTNNRFKLKIEGENVTFTEKYPETGFTETRRAKIIKDDSYIFERPNRDVKILPITRVLQACHKNCNATNPKPSFFTFCPNNTMQLNANWYGTKVTKNAQGQVEQIYQPGDSDSPVILFSFKKQ